MLPKGESTLPHHSPSSYFLSFQPPCFQLGNDPGGACVEAKRRRQKCVPPKCLGTRSKTPSRASPDLCGAPGPRRYNQDSPEGCCSSHGCKSVGWQWCWQWQSERPLLMGLKLQALGLCCGHWGQWLQSLSEHVLVGDLGLVHPGWGSQLRRRSWVLSGKAPLGLGCQVPAAPSRPSLAWWECPQPSG